MADVERIRHKHWTHKKFGYQVEVLDTCNTGCPSVTVDRTRFAHVKRTWTLQKFLQEFAPVGAPFVPLSVWELL